MRSHICVQDFLNPDYFTWDKTTDNLTVITLPCNLPWNRDHISDTPPSWSGDHPEFHQSELFPSAQKQETEQLIRCDSGDLVIQQVGK